MFGIIPRIRCLKAKREWLIRPTWGVYEADIDTITIVRQRKSTDVQVVIVIVHKLLECFLHKLYIKRKK